MRLASNKANGLENRRVSSKKELAPALANEAFTIQ
jgi:hypothetical protein